MGKGSFLSFDIDIMKGRTPLPVGTEKVFNGKNYIKTENGWKPKGNSPNKEKNPKDKKEQSKEDSSKLQSYANKASDSQLKAAIKDPKQEESVKEVAKRELGERIAALKD